MDQSIEIKKLLSQQAALAVFGSFAFHESDLNKILNEAARICAECLGVSHSKICMHRPAQDDLLIVAGCGWNDGVIGQVVSDANELSPQGRAFVTGEPVIIADIQAANNLKLPFFYMEHGIISTIDVLIQGYESGPFGVLEIDSTERHIYDEHDIIFLTGFANVLAEAVATAKRIRDLKAVIAQKNLLSQELHHRVRNNFAMIRSMIDLYMREEDDAVQSKAESILRRVDAIARLYDQLVGKDEVRHIDIAGYLASLCEKHGLISQAAGPKVTIALNTEEVKPDLDTVIAIGMVASELISNAYIHGFPERGGTVLVNLAAATKTAPARLTISDDGVGFVPDPASARHGLELVRRLMAKVDGTADLNSSPSGSTWTMDFTVAPGDGTAAIH